MADKKPPMERKVFALDPVSLAASLTQDVDLTKEEKQTIAGQNGYLGVILDELKKSQKEMATGEMRMAFTVDPSLAHGGENFLYKQKYNLTPNHVIKRITGPNGDDLVNQILQARANHISSFGRPRTSRFSIGFEFEQIHQSEELSDEKLERQQEELEKLKEILWNCGYRGLIEEWSPNMSQFMKMITKDALRFGRFAVEFIPNTDPDVEAKYHSFRAVDAGTIYRLIPQRSNDETKRQQALMELQRLSNVTIDESKYLNDDYKWAQVINGKVHQTFTEEELVVYDVYPSADVEYNGYPLTPIDQTLNAITTHIHITLHNRLYFENGRAARGMLVFNSDEMDESTIQKIKLQFYQSINSVQNSWRMPVFGLGLEDKLTWQPIDNSGRDKEFQFLSDDVARVILGAFQMSPEELPGYAHLARGSNSQTLSESDNEYKLTAARDVGLRPLLYDFQDFFNKYVIPRFNVKLSKTWQLVFAGLEQDTPEKESTRLQQDMALHMTYDEVLKSVEKDPIGDKLGGDFPLNQTWQQSVAPYLTVGMIMENFFGVKGATKDPRYNYIRDPFYFQSQQLLIQKAQAAMQASMMQMQAATGTGQEQGGGEGGGDEGGGDSGGEEESEGGEEGGEEEEGPQGPTGPSRSEPGEDMEKGDKYNSHNFMLLEKSIRHNGSHLTKQILKRHGQAVSNTMKAFEKDSKTNIATIMKALSDNGSK